MQRRILYSLTIIILFLTSSISAQDKGFGLGVVFGEPTGICGKYWTSGRNAISFGMGYSFTSSENRVNLHVDYLFHFENQITSTEKFVLYLGAGGRIKTSESADNSLGVRGVAGIDWLLKKAPVDVFFEIAPVVNIIPSTGVDIDAGIGVRYFF